MESTNISNDFGSGFLFFFETTLERQFKDVSDVRVPQKWQCWLGRYGKLMENDDWTVDEIGYLYWWCYNLYQYLITIKTPLNHNVIGTNKSLFLEFIHQPGTPEFCWRWRTLGTPGWLVLALSVERRLARKWGSRWMVYFQENPNRKFGWWLGVAAWLRKPMETPMPCYALCHGFCFWVILFMPVQKWGEFISGSFGEVPWSHGWSLLIYRILSSWVSPFLAAIK